MAKEINIDLIPKEKLVLANQGDRIKDQKFEDKPIGYFKDAWRRFCKNKASIVAAIIILMIVVFAIVTPFFNTGTGTDFDTRYAKKGPRNLFLSQFGIATGDVEKDMNERGFIYEVAKGIGAEYVDQDVTIGDAVYNGGDLQPVTGINDIKQVQQGKELNNIYI